MANHKWKQAWGESCTPEPAPYANGVPNSYEVTVQEVVSKVTTTTTVRVAPLSAAAPSSLNEGDLVYDQKCKHTALLSQITGMAAGTICFILYFFFCIVFSAVIFSDLTSKTSFGVPQGVGIILLGVGIGCLSFARCSGCQVIISGPDLLPVIFVAESGDAIATYIENEGDSIQKVIPTTLVAMIIGNCCVGAVFFALGSAKKTSAAVGFVPASVISGFLSCIGYKVIKLAVFIGTALFVCEGRVGQSYDPTRPLPSRGQPRPNLTTWLHCVEWGLWGFGCTYCI